MQAGTEGSGMMCHLRELRMRQRLLFMDVSRCSRLATGARPAPLTLLGQWGRGHLVWTPSQSLARRLQVEDSPHNAGKDCVLAIGVATILIAAVVAISGARERSGAAKEPRRLATDKQAAAAGEDRRPVNQVCAGRLPVSVG